MAGAGRRGGRGAEAETTRIEPLATTVSSRIICIGLLNLGWISDDLFFHVLIYLDFR